jgi:GDPmannose 4,6-dehydratase
MIKIALITGGSGQDGSYLAKFLLGKKYKVIVADRRNSRADNWRHKFLEIQNKVIYEDFDLSDFDSIFRLFKKYKFTEVYNLAAQSFVKSSFETALSTANVTALGALRILEVIRIISKNTKYYQASSSEMIGNTLSKKQNENSIFNPMSPYAVAKVFAHQITKNYREAYSMFACSGILFNHESPLRGEEFVTRKISIGLSEIKLGKRSTLQLGNLDSVRDWGFAGDYVEGMWLMLQKKKPDDFVLATNQTCSIRNFVNLCCNHLGIKIIWKGKGKNEVGVNSKNNKIIVRVNEKYCRPSEVFYLKGDYSKAKKILKWKPKVFVNDLAKMMVEYDLKRLSNEKI